MRRSEPFPITLAFPPQGHFTQPHLASPCLTAWLRQAGFLDVQQLDLSIEAYDHLLSPGELARAAERVAERSPLDPTGGAQQLAFRDMRAYRAAAETAASAEVLIDRIEDAKQVLRTERFYDVDAYVPAVRTLYHALRLVSAAHFPTELTPHNFTMGYGNDRSKEVLAALVDEEQNPFLRFYRERVLPRLIERRPRVLGLSVIYGSQLIPALTLGRMVKEALPQCHVTAGGGFLAYIGEKLTRAPGIDACLDSVLYREGEAPLAALCEALRAGQSDLSSVGSMTWFDRRGGTARPVTTPAVHPIPLDAAPTPDFDGLPFHLYFSPEIVLPFDINRGCYYGECTFCTLPTVIGPGYRTRQAQTIVRQTIELRDRYDVRHFNFITDCMPPGMIRDLPEQLIESRANVTWWCDARVEPRAYTPEAAERMYEAGCRKLLFGFETATPRLLKMMKKGQSLRAVAEVAENCAQAGISVTYYAMVGFPSETREEARATLDFIVEHSDVVREVSLQTFHIDEVAETYKNPGAFGIEILDDPHADLQLYHDYVASEGMTREEAAEMFEEMMTGFRRHLPLFAGDNIFYFMQKSHYFLHLARGVRPEEFVERCRRRASARRARGAEPGLRPRPGFTAVDLPFPYAATLQRLADPLARAARPEFTTGRFVVDAQRAAEERLEPVLRAARVLLYDGENCEFVELRPDGLAVLRALEQAGDLGRLLSALDPSLPGAEATRAKLTQFAAELHRLGVLTPGAQPQAAPLRTATLDLDHRVPVTAPPLPGSQVGAAFPTQELQS